MTQSRIERIRETFRIARDIARARQSGHVVISVPKWLAPEVRQLIWTRNVERASDRWARKAPEVSLSEWQEAMSAAAERVKGPDSAD